MTDNTTVNAEPGCSTLKKQQSARMPLVSICMITYNHRDFLAQALDSVLMQKINFPAEIIIHDDCSTDGTTEIVRSYAEKYPDVIRPIFQKQNQYSQGRKPYPWTFKLARGKYIALLDGDDAWTDSKKLQRQFEFLEKNPYHIMCYSNVNFVDGDNYILKEKVIRSQYCRALSQEEIIACRRFIPPGTVMFRYHPIINNLPKSFNAVLCGDIFLFAVLGQYGTAAYIDLEPASYRIHAGGVFTAKSQFQQIYGRLESVRSIHEYIDREFQFCVADTVARLYKDYLDLLRRQGKIKELFPLIPSYIWFSVKNRTLLSILKDVKSGLRYFSSTAKAGTRMAKWV